MGIEETDNNEWSIANGDINKESCRDRGWGNECHFTQPAWPLNWQLNNQLL